MKKAIILLDLDPYDQLNNIYRYRISSTLLFIDNLPVVTLFVLTGPKREETAAACLGRSANLRIKYFATLLSGTSYNLCFFICNLHCPVVSLWLKRKFCHFSFSYGTVSICFFEKK